MQEGSRRKRPRQRKKKRDAERKRKTEELSREAGEEDVLKKSETWGKPAVPNPILPPLDFSRISMLLLKDMTAYPPYLPDFNLI